MSKKRPSDESNSNDQAKEGSDPAFQQGNSAKRANLASIGETTLQDLPIEMIERILIKAVTIEVMSMKLAKSVWRKKANLVIYRLQTVCSQWFSILTTNFFLSEVYRILDGTAQQRIQLEILHQLTVPFLVFRVTTIKDEIFLLCKSNGQLDGEYVINVCKCKDMAVEVKSVILLPRIMYPRGLVACNMSSCLYVLHWDWTVGKVLRIAKDDEISFSTSTLIIDRELYKPTFSISANGSIIIISNPHTYSSQGVVRIYKANGSLQNEIMLIADISRYMYVSFTNVLQKPNGNLVLVSEGNYCGTRLTEINATGNIIHEHRSQVASVFNAKFADVYARIFILNSGHTISLLDSELNLLDFTGPRLHHESPVCSSEIGHSNEWNEEVSIATLWKGKETMLTVFRFTEK